MRTIFAAAALLGAALTATTAFAETRTVPADKLFPFLDSYYKLAPADRSQFHLSYRLHVQGAKPEQVRLTLHEGSGAIPIDTANPTDLSPLPTPAHLKTATVTYVRPDGAKFGVELNVTPNAALDRTMDARALAQAVSQAHAGSKKLAGLLALAVPNLDRVVFYGVTSGEVILANGAARPLPTVAAFTDKEGHLHAAQVVFAPADWPGATSVRFNAVPALAQIGAKS